MSFNLRCEHLINRSTLEKDLVEGEKVPTEIRHLCDAQRDELDNPIPIIECPDDCPFFEDESS